MRNTDGLRSRLESLLIAVGIGIVVISALWEAAAELGVADAVGLSSSLFVLGPLELAGSVVWAAWRERHQISRITDQNPSLRSESQSRHALIG